MVITDHLSEADNGMKVSKALIKSSGIWCFPLWTHCGLCGHNGFASPLIDFSTSILSNLYFVKYKIVGHSDCW